MKCQCEHQKHFSNEVEAEENFGCMSPATTRLSPSYIVCTSCTTLDCMGIIGDKLDKAYPNNPNKNRL